MDVIAIFDIGRNNKGFLLYDAGLNIVHKQEKTFSGNTDEDSFTCDEIAGITSWIRSCISSVFRNRDYNVRGLNFSCYNSSMAFPAEQRNIPDNCSKVRAALHLPEPVSTSAASDAEIEGRIIKTGVGINKNSALLLPYFSVTREQFILVSAGNWCIFINPFNTKAFYNDNLQKDTFFFTSDNGQLVKSSRFCLGPIHDMNVARLDDHFGVTAGYFKTIRIKSKKISRLLAGGYARIFFRNGIPRGYVDNEADLSQFLTYADAYHQMMCDLVDACLGSYRLIIPADDTTEVVYVTGGFAKNDTFVRLLAARLPDKRVFTTDIESTAALGAAMVIYENAMSRELPHIYLGLKAIINNRDN